MSAATKQITDESFASEVLESRGFTLVDFWGEGCGPCIQLAPVLEMIAAEMSDKLAVCKVNVYENPEISSQFGIRGIPTMMLFKDGEKVAVKVGFMTKEALTEWLNSVIIV
jgi:thioredoxin 1